MTDIAIGVSVIIFLVYFLIKLIITGGDFELSIRPKNFVWGHIPWKDFRKIIRILTLKDQIVDVQDHWNIYYVKIATGGKDAYVHLHSNHTIEVVDHHLLQHKTVLSMNLIQHLIYRHYFYSAKRYYKRKLKRDRHRTDMEMLSNTIAAIPEPKDKKVLLSRAESNPKEGRLSLQ